jgi:endonuclease/exonuclease/phosphatase family metal-dependent hydrolase
MPEPLLAASYNIQKGIGADLRRRPDRILAVLAEIGADVVVLQEADRRFGSRRAVLERELLAAHGWTAVPFETRAQSIGWHGNAILVGPRIAIRGHRLLTIPALEPRGAVMAELALDGAPFRVIGMHLDLSGLMRRRQARAILAALADAGRPLPALLMGDLNEWRPRAGCIADFGADHHLVLTGPTYPAPRPIVALDRIFLSGDWRAESAGVHRSPLAATASDHLPAWVRLRLPAD